MKKTLLIMLATFVVIALASCNGGSGSSKSKDIPDYALGETSYFASREGKGAHAFMGFAEGRLGYYKFGMLGNGYHLSGMLVILNGENVTLLNSDESFGECVIEEDSLHIMHALWYDEKQDNPHNSSLEMGSSIRGRAHNKVEGNYSDSYIFAKRKDVAEAVEYLKTLDKQPNQPSQYNPAEHGGTKTYKAKIGKQVTYEGNDSLKVRKFRSLYLDCGAVVEYDDKRFKSNFVGRTIDCVTDDNNKVIVCEFIKD